MPLGGLLGGLIGRGAAAGAASGGGGMLSGIMGTVGSIPIVGGLARTGLQTAGRVISNPLGGGLVGGAAGSALVGGGGGGGGDQPTSFLESLPFVGGLFDDGVPGGPQGRPTLYTRVIARYPNGFEVVRSEERGTPSLMSRDVQRMKKTIRTIRKVDQRIPRKTQRQSAMSVLKDVAVQGAIRNALGGEK